MDYRTLSNGLRTGLRIPALGLGTWAIGGEFNARLATEKQDIALVKSALDVGYSHIDTASIYGAGQTEKIIGEATWDFPREKLFLTTKVWKTDLRYKDVLSSLNSSLGRLRTSYVDLLLVHWPNPSIPLKETMEAMELLYDEGKARAIGVSNFSVSDIMEAQKFLKNATIAVNQIEYNLLKRDAEEELLPFCEKNNILTIAYRPLAKGMLSALNHPLLLELCSKYKKTKPQIALRWVISNKNIAAIAKAGSLAHLKENLDVFDFELSAKDKKALDNLHL